MKKLKPIKSFEQLRPLYQDEDYMVTRDKLDYCELFSRAGTIWDCYDLEEYNKFYNDDIMEDYRSYGYTDKPVYLLVRRSNSNKWIAFDFEDELTSKDPYGNGINVFVEHTWTEDDEYSLIGGALLKD